jgi:hypothetical protein
MTIVKSVVGWFVSVLCVVAIFAFVITNWSWVFAKRVHGEIINVERVTNPTAILGKATDSQIHSYAMLIQNEADGLLYTASSEDRQWQVAEKGYCVDATLYVYPPWNLEKSGTYFNARINQLFRCAGKDLPSANPLPATPPTTH